MPSDAKVVSSGRNDLVMFMEAIGLTDGLGGRNRNAPASLRKLLPTGNVSCLVTAGREMAELRHMKT
ncbi:hypothetical protein ERJ75_000401800 [Trypanosoma vivax]|nr:hypothetical protein ERJ75_000401800 [Trypanosoma vivax]